MTPLTIHLDGDNCWPDLKKHVEADDGTVRRAQVHSVALLRGGMIGGAHSVSFRINLPGGEVVIAEQSWNNVHAAFKAMEIRVAQHKAEDN